MKVITFDNKDLENHAASLAEMARGFKPDLIIGIITGGAVLGCMMKDKFPEASYIEIGNQRAGTKAKKYLHNILKRLPRFITDSLRIIESKYLSKKRIEIKRIELADDLKCKIRDAQRILIVDDAVDSGATLSGVVNAVRGANRDAEIKTATITITTSSPIIIPDYFIYNSNILIRFPWSNDY